MGEQEQEGTETEMEGLLLMDRARTVRLLLECAGSSSLGAAQGDSLQ